MRRDPTARERDFGGDGVYTIGINRLDENPLAIGRTAYHCIDGWNCFPFKRGVESRPIQSARQPVTPEVGSVECIHQVSRSDKNFVATRLNDAACPSIHQV